MQFLLGMVGAMTSPKYFSMPDGRRIAYRHIEGDGPLIVFLPGYMSDMDGGKATAIFERAQAGGKSCLLLDYSGCGQSEGEFAEGTLSRWRDEVLAVIGHVTGGPIILIGSSMGGWLMLLIGEVLGDRLAAMVGIASAPDFTEWGRTEDEKQRLSSGETVFDENPYGPEPTPMHSRFFMDGQAQLQLTGKINIECPVRLLHGQGDEDVPWKITMQLAEQLRSENIQICLVKDGDHRLSRDEDINLLLRQVWSLFE